MIRGGLSGCCFIVLQRKNLSVLLERNSLYLKNINLKENSLILVPQVNRAPILVGGGSVNNRAYPI